MSLGCGALVAVLAVVPVGADDASADDIAISTALVVVRIGSLLIVPVSSLNTVSVEVATNAALDIVLDGLAGEDEVAVLTVVDEASALDVVSALELVSACVCNV